ncbi:MAG: hypothetical protein Q8J64_01065 [Thermodesulfovibrionales bacterium]|nr:hypothetical protein [Thermodesulfovibrionales bacterium]
MKALPLVAIIVFMTSGCSSLLPQARQTTRSPWETFDEAKAAYDRIIPYETTTAELRELGYDPFSTPNIKILTYLDIVERFMANPSIKKQDLDEGVQSCLELKNYCSAYEAAPQNITSKRYGNVLLDLFNFRRKTKESGWKFTALIVLVDRVVVYKLWGGNPIIDNYSEKKNPLGPLQETEDIVREATKALY